MGNRRDYTLDEKYAVVVQYYLSGSYAEASRQTNVPVETIRTWARQEWWEDLFQQVIKDTSAQLRATGQRIVEKATEAVLERLEKGDEVMNKQGVMVRRKVALKDALLASLTWFDKNRIINEQSLRYSEKKVDPKSLIKEMIEIGKAVKQGNLEVLQELPIPTDEDEEESQKGNGYTSISPT